MDDPLSLNSNSAGHLDRSGHRQVTDLLATTPVSPGENSVPLAAEIPLDAVVDEILQRLSSRLVGTPLPAATYRCQFHHGFTFENAIEVLPYLERLGITHIYASPYLKATSGSEHGYNIVDPTVLNPEIGSEEDFARFVAELRSRQMGHLLDFVPNHMGVGTDENPWWQDVLENGPSSPFATMFDIAWKPLKPDLANKVLLPVLGNQFGQVLEEQQLVLHFEAGTFYLTYYERRFPIAPCSYGEVLKHRLDELERRLDLDHSPFQEYQSILTSITHLPSRETTDPVKIQERHREKEIIKRRLQRLCEDSAIVREFIQENVSLFNGVRGDPHSFDLLDALLLSQAYRLSYWRVAADEVNYRRFFDVNELAAVCMECPDVFDKTHVRVLRMLDEGELDGLRIDHADGLYAPTEYLWQLQKCRFLQLCRQEYLDGQRRWESEQPCPTWETVASAAEKRFDRGRHSGSDEPVFRPLYLVVEKILEGKESLPRDWPVHGTTGYEFMNQVNRLFVDPRNAKAFDAIYTRFIGEKRDFDEIVYHSKRLIMRASMAGELNLLGHQLDRLSEQNRRSRDFTLNGLTLALREIVACFPVYRTYTTAAGVLDRDRRYIEQAVARAKHRNPAISLVAFDFVRDVLLMNLPMTDIRPPQQAGSDQRTLPATGAESQVPQLGGPDTPAPHSAEPASLTEPAPPSFTGYDRKSVLEFIGRFQQFTGPMMAKAFEDTAFYNYHRLMSLNEVGGDPKIFGSHVDEFHQFNGHRQTSHPWALSATATHDSKRGEDTRARINVLSEIPERWKEHVLRWARWNKRKKVKIEGELAPSRNVEYLLYQTLIGTWPFISPAGAELDSYVQRLQQYLVKALREGKYHSSWIAPHEAYERATCDFIAAILADNPATAFRIDFEPVAKEIAIHGVWNSLSQTVLKLTAPGVADVYQGAELWDFSLVDPDNRRPVDYTVRRQLLAELTERAHSDNARAALLPELLSAPADGRIKLFLMHELLRKRREHPQLFTIGHYLPLEIDGEGRDHLCAYARHWGNYWAIVLAPRLTATLSMLPGQPPLGTETWRDTMLRLPDKLRGVALNDVLTHERHDEPRGEAWISVSSLLTKFPVAVLMNV